MTEWRETTLGEVIQLQRGFDLTEKSTSPGPFPVISSGGTSYSTNVPKVDGPGVVTGRKGVLGKVHYSPGPYWPHDTTLWVKDFKGSDPRFVYYLLQTLPLAALDAGASNPTLNRNHAHLLPVRVPDATVQGQISSALGAFDDLVEINSRRMEMLDRMAETIHREWFVRFRFPGHEHVAADSLGQLPDGWNVETLAELVCIDKGLSYKGLYLTDSGASMANLKCFKPGGGFRRDGTKRYSGPYKPKHAIQAGDLIVANTDLTQAGTIIGSPAFVPREGFANGGLISHHVFAIRPKRENLRHWLYGVFASETFRAYARSVASGTTVLGFRPQDLLAFEIAVPQPEVLAAYDAVASDLRSIGESLAEANARLESLRTVLLPRLMSGRVDVFRSPSTAR